jgi:hypothetical protein
MLDLACLAERISRLPTEDLLREFLGGFDGLVPEARPVFCTELERRLGDLVSFLEGEHAETGIVRVWIQSASEFRQYSKREVCDGDLALTTRGIGFVPRRRHVDPLVRAVEWANLMPGLSDWMADALRGRVDPEEARGLPISLIARLWPAAAWIRRNRLARLRFNEGILALRGTRVEVVIPEASVIAVAGWANEVDLPFESVDRPRGFWDRLLGP